MKILHDQDANLRTLRKSIALPLVSIFLNVPGHSELVISKTILPRITLLRLTKCTKIGHTSCPFRKTCSYKLKMVGDSERVH